MGKEKISIIIPVYNKENLISRCVDSVINQTYKELEIIIVDDGSTDRSGIICEEYSKKDNRIRVIHKKNGGLSSARNAGLKIATGDYIGFVDSDDWISVDFFEYLLNLLVRYNADISICDYCLTNGLISTENVDESITSLQRDDLLRTFFRVNGERSNSSVCNRLYRRELLYDVEFPDGYVNEDVFFSYFVFIKTKNAVMSNLKKYYYYINNGGITRGALRKQDLSLYYVWDRVVEHTSSYNSPYYEIAVLNRKRAIFTLLSKYVVYGRQDKDCFTDDWLKQETIQLRKARKSLLKQRMFDIKRKAFLLLLCVSPKVLRKLHVMVKGD